MSQNVPFLTIALSKQKPIYIPVDPITIQAKCINPSLTSFEKIDVNRSDWINLSQSLKFTNWIHELDQISPDEILPVAMNILISKCH